MQLIQKLIAIFAALAVFAVQSSAQKCVNPHFDAQRLDFRDLGYPGATEIPADNSPVVALLGHSNGRVYGATTGKQSYLFSYDPKTNKVYPLGLIPGAKGVHHAIVEGKDGKLFIGGGLNEIELLVLSKDMVVDMNAAGGSVVEVGQKCFGENHCLYFGECLQCVTRMRSYDVDFGIVPYPKYDELQENYASVMEWVGGVVSIPRSVDAQMEMVCSMIEGMAYYAVPTLTNLYYELNLKTKMAKDEQSGPMIDMILEYRVYDLAYAFQWGSVVGTLAGTMKPGSKVKVASTTAKYAKNIEKEITKLTIDKDVVDPDDVEMLQDLVTAAVNEAIRQIEELAENEMNKITGPLSGMGIPGL